MTIKAILRPYPDKKKHGLREVTILVSDSGHRSLHATKVFVNPLNWDAEKQCVRKNDFGAEELNRSLQIHLANIKKEVAIHGTDDLRLKRAVPLAGFIDTFLRKQERRNKAVTIDGQLSQARKIKEFAPKQNLQQINTAWMERLEAWCRDVKGNEDGGVTATLSFAKQLVNEGIAQGIFSLNPIIGFTMPTYKPAGKIVISRSEMTAIAELIKTGTLEPLPNKVASYYLLSCYTGLRHADCARLSPDMNKGGKLSLYTSKTTTAVSINMRPELLDLFNSCLALGKLPIATTCNLCLPVIAKAAGIDKHLSFHTARHSFAVECANIGMPIERCSKLMGHSDIKTTQIYYKIANVLLDEAMELWG